MAPDGIWQLTSPPEIKVAELEDFRETDKFSVLSMWYKHCIFKDTINYHFFSNSENPQQKQDWTQSLYVYKIFTAEEWLHYWLQCTQVQYLKH